MSLKNITATWFVFKRGKRFTAELYDFEHHLEENLCLLSNDLNGGTYKHGGYRHFVVSDNKRREISVATVRDRFVHRLVYDHLNKIYDKTFIDDAWSCRLGKGLLGAIERGQQFLKSYPEGFIWKGDVKKFFDSVEHNTLLKILALRIQDNKTFSLLQEIVGSFSSYRGIGRGMPIGNLTSQIFANIYLNELDRFVKHQLKPKAYLRYGDDFILVESDLAKLQNFRTATIEFLNQKLKLEMNVKNDKIIRMGQGLKFLGVILWPQGRTLNRRNFKRVHERLSAANISSYSGLIKKHTNNKEIKHFNWLVQEKAILKNEDCIWPPSL